MDNFNSNLNPNPTPAVGSNPNSNPTSTTTPNPNQPISPQPVNTSMHPTKKKSLITIILLVSGIAIAAIAIIIFVLTGKIDYGPSYQAAKNLNSVVYFLESDDCTRITDYVDNERISDKSYNSRITGCSTVITNINQYSNELRETAAVKKNQEIKAQFERFWEVKETIVPSSDDFTATTDLYRAYHDFLYNSKNITLKTVSDADLQHIANSLTNSSNEQLKTYGEGWLEKMTAYAHAYQACANAESGGSSFSQLLQARNDAKNELDSWITANRPNITTLAKLDFGSSRQLTNEFAKLYDLIKEAYEKNYNPDNGDCVKFFDEVICD